VRVEDAMNRGRLCNEPLVAIAIKNQYLRWSLILQSLMWPLQVVISDPA